MAHEIGGVDGPDHNMDEQADAPLVQEDVNEKKLPWTIYVADALVKVSSTLLSHVLTKRFIHMIIEWCDTPSLWLRYFRTCDKF